MPAILGSCARVVKHLFDLTLALPIARLTLMNTSIGLALFFCALLALAAPLGAGEEEQASIFEGVMLTGMDGSEVAMDSLLDSGPLVVNFWATWCGPCRKELPQLEKLYREFAPKGVQFAAVSVDHRNYAGRVKSVLAQQEMTVPVYVDYETTLAKGFKVKSIPTTIIILEDRSQYYRSKGYRPGDEVLLRKQLQALVETGDGAGDVTAGDGAAGAVPEAASEAGE